MTFDYLILPPNFPFLFPLFLGGMTFDYLILPLNSPFLFPIFLRGNRKGEKNSQSRGQKSCLSARSSLKLCNRTRFLFAIKRIRIPDITYLKKLLLTVSYSCSYYNNGRSGLFEAVLNVKVYSLYQTLSTFPLFKHTLKGNKERGKKGFLPI